MMINYFEPYLDFEKGNVSEDKSFNPELFFDDIKFIMVTQKEDLLKLIKNKEYEDLYNFFVYAKSDNVTQDFYQSIKSQGKIVTSHPLNSDVEIFSQHSVQVGSNNFLRFQSNDEVIYLFQSNFTVECIYIVNKNICIYFPECLNIQDSVKNLLLKLSKNKLYYGQYFHNLPGFGGFKIEHQSPYHFYYFKVRSLFLLLSSIDDKVDIFSSSNGPFLELHNIFSDKVNKHTYVDEYISEGDKKLPSECCLNQFYCIIGSRKTINYRDDKFKNDVLAQDSIVLNYSKKFKSLIIDEVFKDSQYDNFIIWLGITTGKRRWSEEVDAYATLIKRLSTIHKKITVVFDGSTGTHANTRENSKVNNTSLYSEDEKIKNQIISKLSHVKNVKYLSLIGSVAEEKLAVATKVNFFVANHATGSIWVARIARKSGISHISNSARESAISQHVHWDTSLISETVITDIDPTSQQTLFHVSYSIPVDNFLSDFFRKLYEVCNKTNEKENLLSSIDATSIYQFLVKKMKSGCKSPDALYEMALAFEVLGDIDVSLHLIRKAIELRPNGPVLIKKLQEYNDINNDQKL